MALRFLSTSLLAAVLALAVAACDDNPVEPCATFGCGIEGAALALVVAQVDWTSDQPIDDRVGARLVQPGDELTFRYRVLNRGTGPSEPARLFVGTWHNEGNLGTDFRFHDYLEVPALAPGESFAGSVTKIAPNTLSLRTDRSLAEFRLEAQGGAPLPDGYQAHEYRVALPFVTVEAYAAADTLVLGVARPLEVVVRNASAVASLPAGGTILVCLRAWIDSFDVVDCAHDRIEWHDLPELEPGETAFASGPVLIASEDLISVEHPIGHPGLRACVAAPDATAPARSFVCGDAVLAGVRAD